MGLNAKKTTVMSINMYMERYTCEGTGTQTMSEKLKQEIKQLNSQFDKLCSQALHTQQLLQTCLVENLEVKKTIEEIVTWLNHIECALSNIQKGSQTNLEATADDRRATLQVCTNCKQGCKKHDLFKKTF